MENEGFIVVYIGIVFAPEYTEVIATLAYHNGKTRHVSQQFSKDLSAAEIVRMHMDYVNEWPDAKGSKPQG